MSEYRRAWIRIALLAHKSGIMNEEDGELIEQLVCKATPTTPSYEGDGYSDGKIVFDTWICPCCGEYYEIEEEYDYCPKCGQCIDWEMWKGKNDEE